MQSAMTTPENNGKNQWWNENIWRNSDENPKGFSQKNRMFLSLGFKSFISCNLRSFLRVGFFIFRALNVTSWNIRTTFFWENIGRFFGSSISGSIRNFLRVAFFLFLELRVKKAGLHLQKYKKSFFLRKYKKSFSDADFFREKLWGLRPESAGFYFRKYNFFNIRSRKYHFLKYKQLFWRWFFFCLFFFFGGEGRN